MRTPWLLALALVAGCKGQGAPDPTAASASAVASAPAPTASASNRVAATGTPIAPEKIAAVVNPKKMAPYAGPTGTLKGTIRSKGDAPPATGHTFPTGKCGEAAATYSKLFRVGQGGALADAMVNVTEYDGYVPPAEDVEKITIHGCAFARRTVTATFGQRVEIYNLDKLESYLPYLDGATFRAMLVAVPGGDGVKYYPHEPGHYMLRDQLPKPFMTADVFVLKYATHDVTDLDGQYEIKGIPVGKVRVDAFLPATGETSGQHIEIQPGDNTLDLVLPFSLAKHKKQLEKKKPVPAPSSTLQPKG
jgi:hypothetical protein